MNKPSPLNVRLEELRTERGISKSELSRIIGMERKAAYHLINDPTCDPKLSTLRALADFFSVSIDYLVGRTDDMDQIIIRIPPEPPRPHFFNKRWEE